ncbi:MAG: hypothetical protein AAF683_13620 [Pseudomonadota bacterium]
MNPMPQSYEEWEHCITVKCGLSLTPEFVGKRIKALEDRADLSTQKFIAFWGEGHYAKTLEWFRQARSHLKQ